jgi:hypothetical protein
MNGCASAGKTHGRNSTALGFPLFAEGLPNSLFNLAQSRRSLLVARFECRGFSPQRYRKGSKPQGSLSWRNFLA